MTKWNELRDFVIQQTILGASKHSETFEKVLKQMDQLDKKYYKPKDEFKSAGTILRG